MLAKAVFWHFDGVVNDSAEIIDALAFIRAIQFVSWNGFQLVNFVRDCR